MSLLAGVAQADIVNVNASAFNASPGLIDFNSPTGGATNPVIQYGPSGPTVSFGSLFAGQSRNTSTCFGAEFFCVGGAPTTNSALKLASDAPDVAIQKDQAWENARPGTPNATQLGGKSGDVANFFIPIAILLSVDVDGVAFEAGFFNDQEQGGSPGPGVAKVSAFDANGALIGEVTNNTGGIEYFGILSTDSRKIRGVQIALAKPDSSGFTIDNVRLRLAGTQPPTGVPEPGSLALLGAALAALGLMRRRVR